MTMTQTIERRDGGVTIVSPGEGVYSVRVAGSGAALSTPFKSLAEARAFADGWQLSRALAPSPSGWSGCWP